MQDDRRFTEATINGFDFHFQIFRDATVNGHIDTGQTRSFDDRKRSTNLCLQTRPVIDQF